MAVSPCTHHSRSLDLRLSFHKIELLLACVSKVARLADHANPGNELHTAPGTWQGLVWPKWPVQVPPVLSPGKTGARGSCHGLTSPGCSMGGHGVWETEGLIHSQECAGPTESSIPTASSPHRGACSRTFTKPHSQRICPAAAFTGHCPPSQLPRGSRMPRFPSTPSCLQILPPSLASRSSGA